jgi:hypothetical protein
MVSLSPVTQDMWCSPLHGKWIIFHLFLVYHKFKMLTTKKQSIKSFFAKNREISAKREENAKKQQLLAETTVEIETPSQDRIQREFNHCDLLLKRDWFLYPEDIEDLLNDVPEDVCREVYDLINKNKSTYSQKVRDTLAIGEPIPYRGKLKLRDLTDKDLFDMEQSDYEIKKAVRDEAWEKYKEMFFTERPQGEADKRVAQIQTSIDDTKKKIEITSKKNKKYVPPSARKTQTVDPETKALQDNLEILENELIQTNKLIKQLNDDWEREQRYNFEKENS